MRSPDEQHDQGAAGQDVRQQRARQRQVEHQRAPGPRPGRRRRRGPRPRARPAVHRPRAESTAQPSSAGSTGSRASGGTRPRTWRRSSHRRPGRCSMPAVTSRPPRRRSRSTTTDGGPVAASRRPTARASVLAPRPPEAPTTAVTRWWEVIRTASSARGAGASDHADLWTTAPSTQPCGRRVRTERPASVDATESGHGTAPVGGGDPVRGAGSAADEVRTWDGPGRGDNRGRRRAELRGGEAGPPFAQPRGGASEPIVSHDRLPAQALVSTCRDRSQDGPSTTESVGLAHHV